MAKHDLVNTLLALLRTPFEILHLTWLIHSAQLSLLSIVTSRNIVEDTCLTVLSLISSNIFSVGCSKYHEVSLMNVQI